MAQQLTSCSNGHFMAQNEIIPFEYGGDDYNNYPEEDLSQIYYEYDIGDIWKYLALCLIDKIEGEAWRDANT
tara:strand:- start:884 stop:1099 length:216 start_codon:yes stop_codon:yes gene_type:complete